MLDSHRRLSFVDRVAHRVSFAPRQPPRAGPASSRQRQRILPRPRRLGRAYWPPSLVLRVNMPTFMELELDPFPALREGPITG
jgi:hypothetical protein